MLVCEVPPNIPTEIRELNNYQTDDACSRLINGNLQFKIVDIPNCLVSYFEAVSHFHDNHGTTSTSSSTTSSTTTTSSGPTAASGTTTTTLPYELIK